MDTENNDAGCISPNLVQRLDAEELFCLFFPFSILCVIVYFCMKICTSALEML